MSPTSFQTAPPRVIRVEFYSKREYARGACPMAGKTMIPLLAFAAWSGTGKTTLLKKLIPALCARGIRPGLIKHTHHDMDVDKPGKDSYELRKAGAAQTIVASQQRWALMTETPDEEELDLHFLASRMDTSKLDLILVEGFKHEEIAKIVLFRDGAGHRPEELVIDRHVIAVASDVPLNLDVALLDINDVEGLADFVVGVEFYSNNMVNDNDLVSLRKDKKYQALLAQVKDRQPLNVLKKSAPYAKDDAKVEFRYQPKRSNNLCKVRDYFKLDSVAGQGDELSKIINLLHFAHDNIRHDGSNQAFAELDAIDLYNYYKATGKGVNCRQLAISLCEMYLSMGIPARYVTCMPADSLDYECHVINTVWSSQLQKWLYIDPTMDAWVTDENGTLLSIAEVRERLINDQPLVLCETANWNHESQQTKEYYLETYMAKNLYYFVCKKLNRFNPESVYRDNDPEGDVRLIPVGFVNNNWKCDTTTDPEVFWAKPE